jgi:hypothetical protein
MLHALGDNGEWSKLLNIWANSKLKKKNIGYILLGIYKLLNDVKKLKTDYENLVHVYL